MINHFKLRELNEKDISNLKHLNPFWEKDVNYLIKKLNKWLIKFNKDLNQFGISKLINYSSYIEVFKEIDNYKNFLFQKYDLIRNSLRTVKKFYKFIYDYSLILGCCQGIILISDFFNDIETKEIANKHDYFIKKTNDFIVKNIDIFKGKVFSVYKEDEYVSILFKQIIVPKNNLVDIKLLVRQLGSYSNTLLKKKKLTESDFIDVTVNSLELTGFYNAIEYIVNKFVKNIV